MLSRVQLFSDPMDSSLTDSSVHGIAQAIILKWVAISPGDLPSPGIKPTSTALVGRFFTNEPPRMLSIYLYIYRTEQQLCCSIIQSCLTPWDPMNCSMPSLPVLHNLLEFSQVHVHYHPAISFSDTLFSFCLHLLHIIYIHIYLNYMYIYFKNKLQINIIE